MVTYRVLEYAIRETKRQSKNFSSDAKLCGLLIVLLIPDLLYSDHKMAQDTNQQLTLPGGRKFCRTEESTSICRENLHFLYISRPERANSERKKA